MKKLFFVLALCCGFTVANAQKALLDRALNNAVNAAEKGVNKAVTKKVESIAEKQMEAFLNKKLSAYEQKLAEESRKYQEALGAWTDSLVAMSNVPFEDEYVFNTLVNTDVVMTSETGEQETMKCTYYLNKDAQYYGLGIEGMITVVDYKNSVMVCFSTNDTSKVYFAYKCASENIAFPAEVLKPTLGTKTVCGYSCEGYPIKEVYFTGECWVSRSSDLAGLYSNKYIQSVTSEGFPLLSQGTMTNDGGQKVKYVSEAKSVKTNAGFKIRKADYKNMFEE